MATPLGSPSDSHSQTGLFWPPHSPGALHEQITYCRIICVPVFKFQSGETILCLFVCLACSRCSVNACTSRCLINGFEWKEKRLRSFFFFFLNFLFSSLLYTQLCALFADCPSDDFCLFPLLIFPGFWIIPSFVLSLAGRISE